MSNPVTSDRWSEIVRLKDELSLAELSQRFGYTPGEIAAALKRSGVLTAQRSTGDELPPEPGEEGVLPLSSSNAERVRPGSKDGALAARAHMLGNVPDAEVAREAGVSVRTVASYRARHGIAGYRGPRRRSRSRTAPAAASPAASASLSADNLRAWTVRVSDAGVERAGVVLAATLDGALTAARARLQGEVVSVSLAGAVLS